MLQMNSVYDDMKGEKTINCNKLDLLCGLAFIFNDMMCIYLVVIAAFP